MQLEAQSCSRLFAYLHPHGLQVLRWSVQDVKRLPQLHCRRFALHHGEHCVREQGPTCMVCSTLSACKHHTTSTHTRQRGTWLRACMRVCHATLFSESLYVFMAASSYSQLYRGQ